MLGNEGIYPFDLSVRFHNAKLDMEYMDGVPSGTPKVCIVRGSLGADGGSYSLSYAQKYSEDGGQTYISHGVDDNTHKAPAVSVI